MTIITFPRPKRPRLSEAIMDMNDKEFEEYRIRYADYLCKLQHRDDEHDDEPKAS